MTDALAALRTGLVARRLLAGVLVGVTLGLILRWVGDASSVTYALGVVTGMLVSHRPKSRHGR